MVLGNRVLQTSEGRSADGFGAYEWGLVAFAGATWGASFLFIAEGLEGFGPGVVTFLRIAFGMATLSMFPSAREPIPCADAPGIVALGLLWMALPFTLFPIAERHVSSGVAGVLNGAVPVFVAVVAAVMLRRLPGPYQLAGIGLGAGGVILVGLPAFKEGTNSAFGVALLVVAVACYGVAINLAVPLQQRYGALPVLWRAQIVALVLATPYALWSIPTSSFRFTPLAATVVLGVGGTALAYVAASTLAGRVGGTRASLAAYVSPPVALVLGLAIRHEHVASLSVVGAGVVLLGAWLAGHAEARPAKTVVVPGSEGRE